MTDRPKHDEPDDDQRKTDEVLKRLLHTKPSPFTPKKKAKKPAKKDDK